jgi:hypothetical protein
VREGWFFSTDGPGVLAQTAIAVPRFAESFRIEEGPTVFTLELPVSWAKLADQKKINQNSSLRSTLDHACVLFVQHPPKNARTRTVLGRSFVAR